MNEHRIPIREAARLKGVPEETLRRAILSGDLPAEPVPDDRQYLIDAKDLGISRPAPRSNVSLAFPVLLVTGCLVLCLASSMTTSATFVCVNCAAVSELRQFGAVPVRSEIQKTDVTVLVEVAYPGPCAHEWRLHPRGRFRGKCEPCGSGIDRLKNLGILEAAAKVDMKGAADLVRWCLQHGLPDDVASDWLRESPGFASAAAFNEWFARLRGPAH